jgi:hypothetical protein
LEHDAIVLTILGAAVDFRMCLQRLGVCQHPLRRPFKNLMMLPLSIGLPCVFVRRPRSVGIVIETIAVFDQVENHLVRIALTLCASGRR